MLIISNNIGCYVIVVSDSPQKTPLEETCHVNGSHYLGGQIIPTLNPCRSCICVDGFTGM